VHENMKNTKLEVMLDDITLTLWDAISRRVQWRTSIDFDPSATALASTTASQPHTTPGLIFPKTQLHQMQSCPSPIREQPCPSPPWTQSTPLPTPDQTQPPSAPPKVTKNVRAKTKPQRKSSKATKGKQPLKQTTMTIVNPKYVRGQPMLTVDQLHEASQYCVELHNYYIWNYKTSQEIIV
jgi:hypothetical protein